jgi:hypothetical protein
MLLTGAWRAIAFLLVLGILPSLIWADASDESQQAQLFVAQVKGDVSVLHGGQQHSANPPEPLAQSDRVVTGADSTAYLEFQNGGVVEVGANSDVTVKQLEITPQDFKARFLLALGKFRAKVKKLTSSSSTFEVEAGGVVAGVRGTVFGVDYDKIRQQVDAQTYEGSIFTRSGGKEEIVDKGYSMAVEKTGLSVKSPLTGRQMNSFRDFVDVSGQLEEKKQQLLQQMHDNLMNKMPDAVKQHENDLNNALGPKLPF